MKSLESSFKREDRRESNLRWVVLTLCCISTVIKKLI